MSIPVRWLTEQLAICGQIGPEQISTIAEMGFKSIICNRPDDEFGPGQPKANDVKTATETAGLAFAFLPVTPDGGTGMDAKEMGTLLAKLPTPILAYCKTGGRCMALIGTAARMGLEIPR